MLNISILFILLTVKQFNNTQLIMLNKYLFSVINTFSDEDWKEYKKFIKSNDAISGRQYYPLVLLLSKFSGKPVTLKNKSAEELFTKAYGKKFNEQTLLNRQTELLNHTREFLKKRAVDKNILNKENLYSQELLSRNLLDLYSRDTVNADEQVANNIFNVDSYKYLQEFILLSASFHQLKKEQKTSLDIYFRHSRILLADILCSLYRTGQELLVQKYESIDYGLNPVLEFINSIDADSFFKKTEKLNDKMYIIPQIRYYLFKSIQNLDEQKYITKAVKIFYTNEKYFPEYFRTEIYRTLMTYYNMKQNRGESGYYENLFRLFKRKLNQNLVEDLRMCSYPANVFREYILTGLKVRQYKWVDMVIKKYSSLLPENIRQDEVNLAMVRVCFSQREYDKALELINNYKSKNNLHHLDSMRYKLACYFELKQFEKAYSEIDKTKHFLKYNRRRIPEFQSVYFKKFLDKILKILNYLVNPFNKNSEMILFEIESDESTYLMKDWVNEKAREILQNQNKFSKYRN